MDFNYSDEDEAFRREFRQWLEANAPRRADAIAGGRIRAGRRRLEAQAELVS